ncbi:Prenylcysteine oxidase, partial [Blattella germanica]
VVGGGIGGTSACYFLNELFGKDGADIDLYESKKIGGRLSMLKIDGRYYETGGSVIHSRNKYMTDFIKILGSTREKLLLFILSYNMIMIFFHFVGLHKKQNSDTRFGLYNGKEFVFTESSWGLLTLVKLAWRYGFQPLKLQNNIEDMLKNFERIYSLQDKGVTFTSVRDMLDAMNPNFIEDMVSTTKEGFLEEGFSEKLIDELISATLTANYGQSTNVHKFVGSVSVAGAEGGLWSVNQGNSMVPHLLLEHSHAVLNLAKVTNITFRPENDDFILQYKNTISGNNISVYDIIILATPLTKDFHSNIKFENFPREFTFPGKYHRTVCTIIKGKLNLPYFGIENEIDEILTVKLGLEFNSVGRISPVDYKQGESAFNVWKVFSQEPLTTVQIHRLFINYSSVEVVDWLAYPHYHTDERDDMFVLHNNLYHINAIEWAASAMEMSVIGAKNVALLAYKSWNNLPDTAQPIIVKEEL